MVDVKHSNTGAMGRYAKINLADGKGTRGIHGSEIWVAVGQSVHRGQQIGLTGGSAYGNNWGVGAHIHQTLWPTWDYAFGDGATINFMDFVGSGVVAGYQRMAGGAGANYRKEPRGGAEKLDTFPPNSGPYDFDGWIRGENVEGNDVWFRGRYTGGWAWSGGFTDPGTHDLDDLNPKPPAIGPTERKAGADGVRARRTASTAAEIVADQFVTPGTVVAFDGWITGEGVEGNTAWFRRNGVFFWSGGFEDKGTHNLADLNPVKPPAKVNRVVGASPANVRGVPWLTSPSVLSEPVAAAVEVIGYAKAEIVEGNNVWFLRWDQRWMWSGGFTSTAVDGIPLVATPPKPSDPVDQLNNPGNLKTYTPVWDGASFGLEAPLGFQEDGTRADRNVKGSQKVPTTGIISKLILHWTGVLPDQLYYFSILNDRDSCPSFYFRTSGKTFELIRPGVKPASTGPEWNWCSIAVEMQMAAGTPSISPAQKEKAAQLAVRMQEATLFEGGVWDGAKIDFLITRSNIIGHNEALPGETECPGPDMDIDWIVARALQLWDEKYPDVPTPEPTGTIEIDRELAANISATLKAAAAEIDKALNA